MARIIKSILTGIDVTSLGEVANTDTLDGVLAPTITTLTDGATITPNFHESCNFTITLGGNRTLANPSSLTAGQSGSIFIIQDGTGSRTLAYGSSYDFISGAAPTLSTASNSVDRIDYIVRTTSNVHCVFTSLYS